MANLKDINLDELKKEDLKELPALIQAFKSYVKIELGYEDWEADVAAEDMEDPYNAPYIMQDYEGDITVDGVKYEVRYCYTDFCACGLFHLAGVTPFTFYMLFDKSTMKSRSTAAYTKARKAFVI